MIGFAPNEKKSSPSIRNLTINENYFAKKDFEHFVTRNIVLDISKVYCLV